MFALKKCCRIRHPIPLNFYITPMPPKHFALAVLFFAFFACSGDNTFTYGGQTYKTVKICEQVWFAENLNYEAEGSVCYDNNPDNCAKYGRLYNWETAMKVCPEGWHLPSNDEWDELYRFADFPRTFLHPSNQIADENLKAARGWHSSSGNGKDKYGFSALPGGCGRSEGRFKDVDEFGEWWSSSENENHNNKAYIYRINGGFVNWSIYKGDLSSVRCLQDGSAKCPCKCINAIDVPP